MLWTTLMTLPMLMGAGSLLHQRLYTLARSLKKWRQGFCRWHCSHTRCASVGVAQCPDCAQTIVRLWVLPVHDALTDTRRWEWLAEPNYFNTQKAILMTLPVQATGMHARRNG
ncbi:MAG: hypothetical protein QE263_00390 [Vampirovibrionales bacterium]|nr:hypothetical protein [Vampirovibrionales bacterium]